MKNIYKALVLLAASAAMFSGCIKETFPETDVATSDQVAKSPAALKASVDGLVAQTYQRYFFYGSAEQLEYDFSYAGILVTLGRLSCDFVVNGPNVGYDWFGAYVGRQGFGYKSSSFQSKVPFMSLYKMIKSCNDIIGTLGLDGEKLNDDQKQYLGVALAYRALMYYDVYCLYQPYAPNPGVSENYKIEENIVGLTGPIVLSSAEPATQYRTARAPKEAMAAQILSDLDKAEALFKVSSPACGGRYPSLPVVYGLKARLYLAQSLWNEAAEYSKLAIETSGKTPMTSDMLHNPTTAFAKHTADDSWMWYYNISGDSMGNLCNTAGFLAGEADWGYNSLTQLGVQNWLYDNMNYSDIRKSWFIDPDRTTYTADHYQWADAEGYFEAYPFEDLPDYMCFKFRCKDGNWETYNVGGAIDFPIMRVEEMYLIYAEAEGMKKGGDPAALESFMTTYRDPEYSYARRSARFGKGNYFVKNFQEEVYFQKRVELLGEGAGWFDAKRLGVGVHTNYDGSNIVYDVVKYNIEGVSPFWNFTIPQSEIENNEYIIEDGEKPVEIDGVMQTVNNPNTVGSLKNN